MRYEEKAGGKGARKRTAPKAAPKKEVVTVEQLKKEERPVEAAAAAVGAAVAEPKKALVDVVFDKVTAWAASSLEVAKRGLETSARWLDARAKRVGEVATKIAPKPAQ